MATNKRAVKFYAELDVERHLDSIPLQGRSNFINQAIKDAIEKQKKQTELAGLRDWLEASEGPPLYKAMADMLSDYLK